jgi:hypothetical protein
LNGQKNNIENKKSQGGMNIYEHEKEAEKIEIYAMREV